MSAKPSNETDLEKLRFTRVFTPIHIPKELIEQVRDRDYDVDDWYKYQEAICVRQTENGPQFNPMSHLYVIVDEGNKVVGMLWCEIVVLTRTLQVQTFSMDKKYWCRGQAVSLLAKKAKEIARNSKLKRIVLFTNYPKHSERNGFKRSKSVHMELEEIEDGRHIEHVDGRSRSAVCVQEDTGQQVPDGGNRTTPECPNQDRIPESVAGEHDDRSGTGRRRTERDVAAV